MGKVTKKNNIHQQKRLKKVQNLNVIDKIGIMWAKLLFFRHFTHNKKTLRTHNSIALLSPIVLPYCYPWLS